MHRNKDPGAACMFQRHWQKRMRWNFTGKEAAPVCVQDGLYVCAKAACFQCLIVCLLIKTRPCLLWLLSVSGRIQMSFLALSQNFTVTSRFSVIIF